jgi:hypothetical protein
MGQILDFPFVRKLRTHWAVLILIVLMKSRIGRDAVETVFRSALGID